MTRKESRVKYNRTEKGLLSSIYDGQKCSSKTRGHNPPSYTKEWLAEWLFSQPHFQEIFDGWITSGYDKDWKPSVDRKDDELGYSKHNIQLITFKENMDKQNDKQRVGQLYYSNYHKAWIARIQVDSKIVHLKQSKDKEVCQRALDQYLINK